MNIGESTMAVIGLSYVGLLFSLASVVQHLF